MARGSNRLGRNLLGRDLVRARLTRSEERLHQGGFIPPWVRSGVRDAPNGELRGYEQPVIQREGPACAWLVMGKGGTGRID